MHSLYAILGLVLGLGSSTVCLSVCLFSSNAIVCSSSLMPFPLNLLNSRQSSQSHRSDSPNIDGYDTSSSSDSTETAKSLRPQRDHNRPQRPSYVVSSSTSLHTPPGNFVSTPDFILHPSLDHPRPSSSQNSSVPSPSRPHPPLPQFYSTPSSTYTSDADSEPTSPLLSRTRRRRWWVDDSSRWWSSQSDRRRRRRRRDSCFSVRSFKRLIRAIIRHPLFPTQPTSIVSPFSLSFPPLPSLSFNPNLTPVCVFVHAFIDNKNPYFPSLA